MKEPEYKEVAFESAEYRETLLLRDEVLRKPLGIRFSADQLRTEHQDWHLALFTGTACLACCVLSRINGDTVKLRQMAVSPALQGKKLGTKLLQEAERFAREKGFSKVILHARAYALPFYEKAGYQTRGGEFEEVGIPHYLMEKGVSDS